MFAASSVYNGWFVLALFCAVPFIFCSLVFWSQVDTLPCSRNYKAMYVTLMGLIVSFLASFALTMCGFIYPEKLMYDPKSMQCNASLGKQQIKTIVVEVLKEMPVQEKYEILSK